MIIIKSLLSREVVFYQKQVHYYTKGMKDFMRRIENDEDACIFWKKLIIISSLLSSEVVFLSKASTLRYKGCVRLHEKNNK